MVMASLLIGTSVLALRLEARLQKMIVWLYARGKWPALLQHDRGVAQVADSTYKVTRAGLTEMQRYAPASHVNAEGLQDASQLNGRAGATKVGVSMRATGPGCCKTLESR
jgi:hypothetical protein